jgi:hypothetical protein
MGSAGGPDGLCYGGGGYNEAMETRGNSALPARQRPARAQVKVA